MSGVLCRINNPKVLKSAYTLFFTILNILFTFSSQVLFWSLGYSVLTRSGSNNMRFWAYTSYEHNKRCTNMHVRATLCKYRVLRYLVWFLEEKCSHQYLLVCLECSFYGRTAGQFSGKRCWLPVVNIRQ